MVQVVTEKILDVLVSIVRMLLGWLPGYDVPSTGGSLGGLLGSTAGKLLGQWVDLAALVTGVGVVVSAWAVAMGVKGSRILISHFTGGGGSAA